MRRKPNVPALSLTLRLEKNKNLFLKKEGYFIQIVQQTVQRTCCPLSPQDKSNAGTPERLSSFHSSPN